MASTTTSLVLLLEGMYWSHYLTTFSNFSLGTSFSPLPIHTNPHYCTTHLGKYNERLLHKEMRDTNAIQAHKVTNCSRHFSCPLASFLTTSPLPRLLKTSSDVPVYPPHPWIHHPPSRSGLCPGTHPFVLKCALCPSMSPSRRNSSLIEFPPPMTTVLSLILYLQWLRERTFCPRSTTPLLRPSISPLSLEIRREKRKQSKIRSNPIGEKRLICT